MFQRPTKIISIPFAATISRVPRFRFSKFSQIIPYFIKNQSQTEISELRPKTTVPRVLENEI